MRKLSVVRVTTVSTIVDYLKAGQRTGFVRLIHIPD